mgnify:CR=1 FL=1
MSHRMRLTAAALIMIVTASGPWTGLVKAQNGSADAQGGKMILSLTSIGRSNFRISARKLERGARRTT